ncbi:hypothetical protein DPX16_17050 [Anabarilius grahami]|uniref:Uncharacterized protein n=1 Tax=Anabarilius grahami TaxID=495550 RepID=A0A3N0YAG2_ANAGA|nr:hypothetical protein DPX16_17050 [Anabarilius grahami]
MGEGGERVRETGREGDVSDWLCLLDSHRFSFVLHRESRQRANSSLSHLDHGQVASPVPLSHTLPPVSETLLFPASKVRIKVKRLSFKASLSYICSCLPGTPKWLAGLKHHLEVPFVFSGEVSSGSSLGLNLILLNMKRDQWVGTERTQGQPQYPRNHLVCSPNIWASQRWVELGVCGTRGGGVEGERAIHTLSVGLENRGGQLRWRAAAFSWVPQLEDVQALLRQSSEGEDHVPQYCHCLCHSSTPGSSGARRGVTGLNTDAGQMAASISRQLSVLKCGVNAGTCQDESHLSPCAFSSDKDESYEGCVKVQRCVRRAFRAIRRKWICFDMHMRPFKNDRELDCTLAVYYSNVGRVIERVVYKQLNAINSLSPSCVIHSESRSEKCMALMKDVSISPLKNNYVLYEGNVMEALCQTYSTPLRYVFFVPVPSASFIHFRICLRQQVPPMALLLG